MDKLLKTKILEKLNHLDNKVDVNEIDEKLLLESMKFKDFLKQEKIYDFQSFWNEIDTDLKNKGTKTKYASIINSFLGVDKEKYEYFKLKEELTFVDDLIKWTQNEILEYWLIKSTNAEELLEIIKNFK